MERETGSEGRVYYGQTFTAPCGNDFWQEDTHEYRDCAGTVTFGPDDRQAACGTCGGQCGRLVAFGLPSGSPYRNQAGEDVNEFGDVRCPRDGQRVNKRCWSCGWVRPTGT